LDGRALPEGAAVPVAEE
jgi:hypothetical protein